MTTIQITKPQARRFLLQHHGLLGRHRYAGEDGILDFVRQAGCIQYDPIDICGKNSELVFQSRVAGFTKPLLYKLLYVDRRLIDYFDKNMSIFATEDWPYFQRKRAAYGDNHQTQVLEPLLDQIRDYITQEGPAASRHLDLNDKVNWAWGPTTQARAALETLYFRGELVIHHRRRTVRHYALAEDCLPQEILNAPDPNPTTEAYHAWLVHRRIRSVGLLWNKGSDAWLGIDGLNAAARNAAFDHLQRQGSIQPLQVEGMRDTLYVCSEYVSLLPDSGVDTPQRTEFIAPLDNLLWDRRLIRQLFDFEYRWEIYTPPAKRKFGYYVLPVLHGDRFVGRVEVTPDKRDGRLRLQNTWLEPRISLTPALRSGLEQCTDKLSTMRSGPDYPAECDPTKQP